MDTLNVKTPSQAAGFTLIELLITVAVASVLLAIAAPSFRDMSIRSNVSGYSNDIIASVNYARSEAVRRGLPVSICSTDDNGASCSGDWSDGWMIFVNADGDSPATLGDPDDGEVLLKVYPALPENYSLGADGALASDLTYLSDGAARNTGVMALCFDDEIEGAKAVAITRLRPRMSTDTNGDRIPNLDDGVTNINSCASPSGV